ncbi:MAG: universal stress protein [Planctomyces sp.]|nr:universal stress protein [Planctomyces sp.]
MNAPKNVLLATDFAQASEESLNVAARLAAQFGSEITLLNVLEPMPQWPVAIHELRETASGVLTLWTDRLAKQGVKVAASLVEVGAPADMIVQTADQIGADLILCGAGLLSPFDRYSAGPIAMSVIEHAKQPVLAVRPHGRPATFQKILCPVDHSAAAAEGFKTAAGLARAFSGELTILTVVPDVSTLVAAAEARQFEDAKLIYETRWREEFQAFLDKHESTLAGTRHTSEVRVGKPHQQIDAAAEAHGSDLIVVGATGRTGLARMLLGSTTRRLLGGLPCSLLAVKPPAV